MANGAELSKGITINSNMIVYAILAALTGGSGLNFLAENTEETERNEVVTEFREADYIQDTKYDALLARVAAMDTNLQLLEQEVENLHDDN